MNMRMEQHEAEDIGGAGSHKTLVDTKVPPG